MTTQQNTMLDKDGQLSDFHDAMRKLGFDPSDFEIMTSYWQSPEPAGIYRTIYGDAKVRRISNNRQLTFPGNKWSAEAILAAKAGAFGAP